MKQEWIIILSVIASSSVLGMLLTIYDKIAAKKIKKHRIPEAVLMTVGACGGALAMYLVMRIIRHKTRKPKFSKGFPVIIIIQLILLIIYFFFLT